MEDLTNNYWNTRYLTNDFSWDTGRITEPLKAYIEQLSNKNISILIPGAGNSYEAEFLFNKGFTNITVLDFAEEPLKNIKARLPNFPSEHLKQQDFFEHVGQYDLIIEQTFFCAINPNLRHNYVDKMHQLLKPNGKLVGLLFDDVLNSNKPPFGGNKAEYIVLFSPLFKIKTLENCYNSILPRKGRELFFIFEKMPNT
jgi:methyl halide transferase